MNRTDKIIYWTYASLISFAISWIVIVLIHRPIGLYFALLTFAFGEVVCYYSSKTEDPALLNTEPLLFTLIILLACLFLAFCKQGALLLPFSVSGILIALMQLYKWLHNKSYHGKGLRTLLDEEIRLPVVLDILLIISSISDLIKHGNSFPLWLIVLLLVFSIQDLYRNIIRSKRH